MILRSIAIAAVLFAAPAAAEVVEQTDNGFATRDSATVSATPYEAWQALIAPARWWNDGHTWSGDAENMFLSAQGGGCFCEQLPVREGAPEGVRRGSALHMTVLQADPPRVLRMRGGLGPLQSEPVDGVLTVTLAEAEGGTRIVWEYVVGGHMRFEVPTIARAVDGVMSQQLRGLAALLGPVAAPAAPPATEPAEAEAPARPSVSEAFEDIDQGE
jgi:uncharacterized protein YndB with AHSA1/START domain